MPDFKLIFGVVGNFVSVVMFLSPVHTFQIIIRNKSTLDFSGLTIVFMLFSSLLWVLYGIPLVTQGAILVLTINGVGALLQSIFITLFLIYANKRKRRIVALCLIAILLGVTLFASINLLAVKQRSIRQQVVGSVCVALNIAMTIAPLSVLKLVIVTKSADFMPFWVSFFISLNSAVWTGYGIFSTDIFLIIPNGVGLVFGLFQLSLHVVYRGNKSLVDLEKGPKTTKSDSKPYAKTGDFQVSTEGAADETGGAKPAELPQGLVITSDGHLI